MKQDLVTSKMTMERTKRIFTFLTFFVCTACLAALTASLATHKWLVARPVRLTVLNGSSELLDDDGSGKFRGQISFGLFQGTRVLNYGFGDRLSTLWSELIFFDTLDIRFEALRFCDARKCDSLYASQLGAFLIAIEVNLLCGGRENLGFWVGLDLFLFGCL